MDVNGYRRAWARRRARDGRLAPAWDLGQLLRPAAQQTGRLVIVGSAAFEPWHVTAHFDDEARYAGMPWLRPKLLRWRPDPTAPAHLRHSIDELREAGRHQTVLVVSASPLEAEALERLADARRSGAVLMGITEQDSELASLTGDYVSAAPVPAGDSASASTGEFELVTHVVPVSAGTVSRGRRW